MSLYTMSFHAIQWVYYPRNWVTGGHGDQIPRLTCLKGYLLVGTTTPEKISAIIPGHSPATGRVADVSFLVSLNRVPVTTILQPEQCLQQVFLSLSRSSHCVLRRGISQFSLSVRQSSLTTRPRRYAPTQLMIA